MQSRDYKRTLCSSQKWTGVKSSPEGIFQSRTYLNVVLFVLQINIGPFQTCGIKLNFEWFEVLLKMLNLWIEVLLWALWAFIQLFELFCYCYVCCNVCPILLICVYIETFSSRYFRKKSSKFHLKVSIQGTFYNVFIEKTQCFIMVNLCFLFVIQVS